MAGLSSLFSALRSLGVSLVHWSFIYIKIHSLKGLNEKASIVTVIAGRQQLHEAMTV